MAVLRKAEKVEIKLGHPLGLEDANFVDQKYRNFEVKGKKRFV